ncbi:MAG: hypothetical protein ACO225_14660, partial [Ilumatobacteraceae bacterium]
HRFHRRRTARPEELVGIEAGTPVPDAFDRDDAGSIAFMDTRVGAQQQSDTRRGIDDARNDGAGGDYPADGGDGTATSAPSESGLVFIGGDVDPDDLDRDTGVGPIDESHLTGGGIVDPPIDGGDSPAGDPSSPIIGGGPIIGSGPRRLLASESDGIDGETGDTGESSDLDVGDVDPESATALFDDQFDEGLGFGRHLDVFDRSIGTTDDDVADSFDGLDG